MVVTVVIVVTVLVVVTVVTVVTVVVVETVVVIKTFILGRPFNRLIIRGRDFVCMRQPSLTVIKFRDRAGL